MNEFFLQALADERVADLRRDAARHARAASRADRAAPRWRRRVTHALALPAVHRSAAIGCEA